MGLVQLNRDVIAEAALRVAARGDSEALRIRDIGAELGADPTAIYRHYRSRDELLFDLVERVAQQVFLDFVQDERPWRERLRRGALAIVDRLVEYPSVGVAAVRDRPVAAWELRLADLVLRALLESGVEKERGVRLYAALSSFVLASAAQLCAEKVAAVTAAAGSAEAGKVSYNRPWVIPTAEAPLDLVPTLADAWPSVSRLCRYDAFEAGVDAILDAVEFAASRD